MAKGKNKIVKSMRLSSPAGAREVDIGHAPAEQRQRNDFSKRGIKSSDTEFADHEATKRRWGANF